MIRSCCLSRLAIPWFVSINGQSYVGGRRIDGKGEMIGHFLCKNSVDNNTALIEIKKLQSPVAKKYRDDLYGPHDELSGGVTQFLDQRQHFTYSQVSVASV